MVNAALRLGWLFSPLRFNPYYYFVPLPRLHRTLEFAQIISRWSSGGPSQYSSQAVNLIAWRSFLRFLEVCSQRTWAVTLCHTAFRPFLPWHSGWVTQAQKVTFEVPSVFCDQVLWFAPGLGAKEINSLVHVHKEQMAQICPHGRARLWLGIVSAGATALSATLWWLS